MDTAGSPTSDSLVLGRRIRHARHQAALTLQQLATATGATTSHLSLVENGRREWATPEGH